MALHIVPFERSFLHSPLKLSCGYLPKSKSDSYPQTYLTNWHLCVTLGKFLNFSEPEILGSALEITSQALLPELCVNEMCVSKMVLCTEYSYNKYSTMNCVY